MITNNKKTFAQSGLEAVAISKKARKLLCFLKNNKSVIRYVKRQMNKRMRKYNKQLTQEIE